MTPEEWRQVSYMCVVPFGPMELNCFGFEETPEPHYLYYKVADILRVLENRKKVSDKVDKPIAPLSSS